MAEESKSLLRLRRNAGDVALRPLPPLELQHTWFRAARARAWNTLVVVPADGSVELGQVIHGLGQMAGQEPTARVLVVDASIRNCRPRGKRGGDGPTAVDDLGSILSENVSGNYDFMDFSMLPAEEAERALALAPQLLDYVSSSDNRYTTVIVSLDSLLVQTRAIPVARAADACIICASLGTTTFRAMHEIVEIVGKERVIGSITLKPRSTKVR